MDFLDLLQRYGLPLAALVIVTVAFVRGDIVPGYVYKEALGQRDRALDAAERLVNAAEVAATLAERTVRSHSVRT